MQRNYVGPSEESSCTSIQNENKTIGYNAKIKNIQTGLRLDETAFTWISLSKIDVKASKVQFRTVQILVN